MKLFISAAAMLLLSSSAWSYIPPTQTAGSLAGLDASGTTITPTGAPNNMVLGDAFAQAPYVNIRNFFSGTSASCSTDAAPAMTKAVSLGFMNLFLPANCTIIAPANLIPAGVHILGAGITSVISSTDRTLYNFGLGAGASYENVGLIDKQCDLNGAPYTKTCWTIGRYSNGTNSVSQPNPWPIQTMVLHLGPYTQGGNVMGGYQGPSIVSNGAGSDNFYSAVQGGSSSNGINIATSSPGGSGGDNGVLVRDGFGDGDTTGSATHNGIDVSEYGNDQGIGGTGASILVWRYGHNGDVEQSLFIGDANATSNTNTAPFIRLSANKQASGDLMAVYGSTTNFSGNVMRVNMGNVSQSFTGNFAEYQIGGSDVAKVDHTGQGRFSSSVNGAVGPQAATLPAGSSCATYNVVFSTVNDSYADACFQLQAHGTDASGGGVTLVPTTDGTGAPSTSNCANVTANNDKAILSNIALVVTDETTPANDFFWSIPTAALRRFTGVASTKFDLMGTPSLISDGTGSSVTVTTSADTTNACGLFTIHLPGGNADVWRAQIVFRKHRIQ